jgi:hypothetical protein
MPFWAYWSHLEGHLFSALQLFSVGEGDLLSGIVVITSTSVATVTVVVASLIPF